MALTEEQVAIIKATVPVLKEYGKAITTTFYSTLIGEHPELNNIFNHSNQVNGHQAGALAGSLYAYASHIDDLGALSPAVEKICQRHASLYIQPEHYDVVGTYLLRAMGDVLGDALTPEILEAWKVAYFQLAKIMINREENLMKQREGWTEWRDFRIAKKVPESSEITSFYLEPTDGGNLPSFLPGQYVSVMMDVPELKYMQPRQYSLSDAPNPTYYRISVKRDMGAQTADSHNFRPGYISNILHSSTQVGDIVKVSHPAGEFYCDIDCTEGPVVLISAGVGLTPMLSILNTVVQKQQTSRKISWIHACRSSEVHAFADHIQETIKRDPNVTAVVFNKQPGEGAIEGVDYMFRSRMDLDVLDGERDLHLDDRRTMYYICGPGGFMTSMSEKLQSFGIEESRVRVEVFGTGEGAR